MSVEKHRWGKPLACRTVDVEGVKVKLIEICDVESVELKVIDFKKLLETLSEPYIEEGELGVIILEKEDTYFIAKIIDFENGGSIFLSANEESAVAEPGETGASPKTLQKLLNLASNALAVENQK